MIKHGYCYRQTHKEGGKCGKQHYRLTLPLVSLLSPMIGKFCARTPLVGSKTASPLGPLPPYIPFRNCRIVSSELTLFSTSPEARCIWYASCGKGPLTSFSIEWYSF